MGKWEKLGARSQEITVRETALTGPDHDEAGPGGGVDE